jgi:cell division transport system permease protein
MRSWLGQHRRALERAVRRLAQAPASSLLGALVIGIALALPAGGEMLLANLLSLGERVSGRPEISVFLTLDAGKQDVTEVLSRLKQEPRVRAFRHIAREDTLARLRENEGLADVLDALPQNPFPETFVVEPIPDSAEALEALRETLSAWPKVEHAQLDSAWVRRVEAMLRLGRGAVLVLGGLLGLALVVVTFNTIRLQILSQREEIELARMLGATDGFVRRPFFYFGALQGLLGGLIAWSIVSSAAELLRAPLTDLASLYSLTFTARGLPMRAVLVLLAFSLVLGWVGAWASVAQHLRDR